MLNSDLKIGTSGYDYYDWVGTFYPTTLPRKKFLTWYTEYFQTLELNFTYYKMPSVTQMKTFALSTPDEFDFSVKANESMTHKVDQNLWRGETKKFCKSLDPLLENNKLTSVLLQFPFSFHYTPENRLYLKNIIQQMGSFPVVVEFRNSRWLSNRVFDGLRKFNAGFCITDAPRLKGVPSTMDITTSDVAYIRFHGRNEANWWGTDATSRFDYLYNQQEISGWISRIKTIVNMSSKLRIYFNNHSKGKAVTNALMLKKLLEKID